MLEFGVANQYMSFNIGSDSFELRKTHHAYVSLSARIDF
jgi:hypothetical protein